MRNKHGKWGNGKWGKNVSYIFESGECELQHAKFDVHKTVDLWLSEISYNRYLGVMQI